MAESASVKKIDKGSKLTVLFGAGASFGYAGKGHAVPPLGGYLYPNLRNDPLCPAWHEPEVVALFARHKGDFESAMAELTANQHQTPSLFGLASEMCRHLVSFELPASGRTNLYATLLNALLATGRCAETLLCTLNYECLLEETILRLVGGLRYIMPTLPIDDRLGIKPATVLKMHGSSNWLIPGLENFASVGSQVYLGPVDVVLPGEELRKRYDGKGPSPYICHYAPGKPAHIEPKLKFLSHAWQAAVGRSDAVIIIGAAVNDADDHIWEPIWHSSVDVYYIGGPTAQLGTRLGSRFHFLGDTFESGMAGLLQLFS